MKRLRTVLFSGMGLIRLASLVLVALLLMMRVADPVFVSNFRHQTFDLFQRTKPRPVTPQPVVIVDIDEASLAREGQWPWPRTLLAELVNELAAAGVIATGFDMVFAEADRLSPSRIADDNEALPANVREQLIALPDNEESFAKAISASRVVLGETGAREQPATVNKVDVSKTPHAIKGEDPRRFLVRFQFLVQNLEPMNGAAAGHGVFSVDPDPDGVFRKMPLVMEADNELRLGLSAEVLRVATGGNAFLLNGNAAGVTGLTVGGVAIPTDRNGKIWPWFSRSHPGRYVSAASVLTGTARQFIAGKMALVGTSSVGLEDYRATPVDPAMPGVEIHAQIIENILTGTYLVRPYYALGMELVIVALAGLVIIALVPWLNAYFSAALAAVIVGAFAAGSWWAFDHFRILFDPTFPIGATIAMFVAATTGNYIREESQRRQIRSAFGQYLSPALVDQLSDDPDRLALGGETRELSILFTDVRGFTTISESFKSNPQGLTLLMNRFLTAMSNAILEEEGTIDKYMGDAIMAFWNAPLDQDDHAMRACRAALAILEAVDQLNRERASENDGGKPIHKIKIGVGINSGECVVGNMGSEMRFDYTALGDAVNLASRLEGQSKPFGILVVLGENTANVVGEEMAVIEIDLIRVKGKQEPERIFALLGDEQLCQNEKFAELSRVNASMISAYRRRDWDTASAAMDVISELSQKLNIDLAEYLLVYEERIAEFEVNPPGHNWDAVYVALDK